MNGITRIKSHLREKDFWQYGILFVTDNNIFDKLSIDYLEYYFIQAFSKTQYSLENHDLRKLAPNVNMFNLSTLNSYTLQIQFLLEAMGISFKPSTSVEVDNHNDEIFHARSQHQASIRLQDGKYILQANSIIKAPLDHTKDWKDGGVFYLRSKRRYDQFVESGKAIELDEYSAKIIDDMEFNSPSTPAVLCSGRAENGWVFWEGLNKKRENLK
ncbi:DUF4357 domain-containing protein [Planococcus salinarum]|uniref:DUF4357 domain-containing protein n=1 Tax=Planococcus salinarum TaxID=622695 RepID=UPI00115DF6A5|nr:DUF4357 domain-containing protein [Planococcus salinarum]TAA73391.1 DUF4357 domain-containing protein [Planococcus salinarum]